MASDASKPDLYVVARFLDVLWPGTNGAKVTKEYTKARLQEATWLNYDAFRRYLERLVEKQLIQRVDGRQGRPVYVLTEQGIEAHGRIVGWVRDFIEGRP